MMKCTPIIICRLCDKSGRILNAYEQDSIRFTELTSPKSRFERRMRLMSGKIVDINGALISIEGYVSVCIDEWNLSSPVPFRIIQRIWVCASEQAILKFTVNNFVCQATPICGGFAEQLIRIMVNIETRVIAAEERLVKAGEESSVVLSETADTVSMLSRACLIRRVDQIEAKTYQYAAISDGTKRVYTDADEVKDCDDHGILSPKEASYYNLYVNGVMQPKVNYIMTKGRLEFITEDLPTQGAMINIKYIIFQRKYRVNFTDDQYYTIADGFKRVYTNADALGKYSTNGIPGPQEVSYYNLYVNGVLQPKQNYIVEKGMLKFITEDIPQKGRTIILESIAIKDVSGYLLEVEDYQYDSLAQESRVYCSDEDITPYGQGILSPQLTSYQNLIVNSVNQCGIDYKVDGSCLVFKTVDLPSVGSPITLQSVRVLNKQCCGRSCDIWVGLLAVAMMACFR